MHILNCIVLTAHCMLHTLNYILYTAHCKRNTAHNTLHTKHCTLHSELYTAIVWVVYTTCQNMMEVLPIRQPWLTTGCAELMNYTMHFTCVIHWCNTLVKYTDIIHW